MFQVSKLSGILLSLPFHNSESPHLSCLICRTYVGSPVIRKSGTFGTLAPSTKSAALLQTVAEAEAGRQGRGGKSGGEVEVPGAPCCSASLLDL